MLIPNRFDKKIHKNLLIQSNPNKYTFKKEFYSYIIKQFYYYSIRQELRKYLQHGNTNILKHCRNVAYHSFVTAKKLEKIFNIRFDYKALIIGAYLHDLFMYDWHEKSKKHRFHGFTHPKTASINAKRLCNISKKEQSIIESHMWPLTITKIPTSKEAFLVCLFDKYSATKETLLGRFYYLLYLNYFFIRLFYSLRCI